MDEKSYLGSRYHDDEAGLRRFWGRVDLAAGAAFGFLVAGWIAKVSAMPILVYALIGAAGGAIAGMMLPGAFLVFGVGFMVGFMNAAWLGSGRVLAGALAGAGVLYAFGKLSGRAKAMKRLEDLVAAREAAENDINPWAVDGDFSTLRGAQLSLHDTQDLQAYYGRKGRRERGGSGVYEEYFQGRVVRFGGFPLDPKVEAKHGVILASTGAGKTVALKEMIADIRARGDRALVLDNNYEFMRAFWREGDVLLNPLDARSAKWQPLNEVRFTPDWISFSKSLIPQTSGPDGVWKSNAATFFADVAKRLGKKATTQALLEHCAVKPAEALAPLFKGTRTGVMFDSGADRFLSGVRTVFSEHMAPWDYLPATGDFSIREWVQRESGSDFLWMPYTATTRDLVRDLIRLWADIAVNAALERRIGGTSRLWIIVDECDSMGKLPSLLPAVTQLRKFSTAVILAGQSISQFRKTYSTEDATTLMSCLTSKLILRCADSETANAMARELGKAEVEREVTNHSTSVSYSLGPQGGGSESSGSSTSTHRDMRDIVIAGELQNLPDLQGYVKVAEKSLIYRVRLSTDKLPRDPVIEGFIPAPGLSIDDLEEKAALAAAPAWAKPEDRYLEILNNPQVRMLHVDNHPILMKARGQDVPGRGARNDEYDNGRQDAA